MYTQQMRGSTRVSLSNRNGVLPPTVLRPFSGRSVAARSSRSAGPPRVVRPQAVLEKLGLGSPKRDLPTKGIDFKPQNNSNAVQTDILKKLAYVVGADPKAVSDRQAYQGVALSVREQLIERFNKTQEHWR